MHMNPFLVANNLTIADVSVSVSVLPLGVYASLYADKHSTIIAWLNCIKKTIPIFEEINSKAVEDLRQMVKNQLTENKQNQ